ncbi:MAG: DMT family transporter [Proteobacteria bacterium]|nr:DMT family transporter [Pseudomonadota bacterium]
MLAPRTGARPAEASRPFRLRRLRSPAPGAGRSNGEPVSQGKAVTGVSEPSAAQRTNEAQASGPPSEASIHRGPRGGWTDVGSRRLGYLFAVIAVSLFSTSPALVRYAPLVGPIEVTFWRLLTGAATILIVSSIVSPRGDARSGAGPGINFRAIATPKFAIYGLLVALHFGSYIASLGFTSTAHSLAITYTAPVFVAMFAHVFLHESIRPQAWIGIAIAVAGAVFLTGFEPTLTTRSLIGDGMALFTAVTFGIYSIIGRQARNQHTLFEYAFGVYLWGAIWLLPAAIWSMGGSTYDVVSGLAIIALGVAPLGTGHTLYNAALRRIPATAANIIAMLEVIGGVILTAWLFGEMPTSTSIAGAGVILAGILIVVWEPSST